jgi:hypothetical protein
MMVIMTPAVASVATRCPAASIAHFYRNFHVTQGQTRPRGLVVIGFGDLIEGDGV